MAEPFRQRLRSGDDALARTLRAARRGVAKGRAVAMSRSIPHYMDDVVASVPSVPREPASARRPGVPKIAAFSTYPIHPRRGGGQLRGWYLAEGLARGGANEVHLVSLTTAPANAGVRSLGDSVTEECIFIDAAASKREADLRLVAADVSITDIASGLMWNGIDGFTDAARRALDGAASAIAVQPYLIDAIETLAGGIPLVYDSHNDEVELKSTILPEEATGARWLTRWVDDFERRSCENASLVTTTTDTDLHTLNIRYKISAPTDIVPNGVDTSEIEFVTGPERTARRQVLDPRIGLSGNRPVALFVGSGHLPNIEAGRSIIQLAGDVPDVDFVLAGDHSTRLATPTLPPNVRLLGPVNADLLELLLTSATLALNPMRAGSGSNLKLFSYLAAGLPVIATPIGARGVAADEAGVVTAVPSGFAEAIGVVLSEDPEERAIAGRNYVEANCDWRIIGDRFADLVARFATR